jgi:restriction endonuclease Mrr
VRALQPLHSRRGDPEGESMSTKEEIHALIDANRKEHDRLSDLLALNAQEFEHLLDDLDRAEGYYD